MVGKTLKNDFEWLEDDYKYEIIFSLKHLAQIRLSLLTFQTVKKYMKKLLLLKNIMFA